MEKYEGENRNLGEKRRRQMNPEACIYSTAEKKSCSLKPSTGTFGNNIIMNL